MQNALISTHPLYRSHFVETTLEVLPIGNRGSLSLTCDWGVGIGGGLWSTGLLMTKHLCAYPSFYDNLLAGRRVLELGSGTGLVGLTAAMFGPPSEVVITDLASHIDICSHNLTANVDLIPDQCKVRVEEYDWGSDCSSSLSRFPFDVVIGTDVAYYEHLHEPLIKALLATTGPETLILLGVTRMDTGPDFFEALDQAGFEFYLMEQASSNKAFGLFCVFRERQNA
ncbi:unnamed protein product [Choristocarpus tenellus]